MAFLSRLLSFVLLLGGVALVFLGLTRSLGLTPGSVLASAAAIAALLYTGGVWFGSAAAPQIPAPASDCSVPLLFDLGGRLLGGPAAGEPVASRFPESARREIERQCAVALAGRAGRFPSVCDGEVLLFDVLPIQNASGAVLYGIVVPLGSGAPLAGA